MFFKTLKKIIGLGSLFFVSIVLIIVGLSTLNDNFKREVLKVKSISGKLISRKTIEKNSQVGAVPYRANVNTTHLSIRLNTTDKVFNTFKPDQDYLELIEKLKIGKEVIIYYNNKPNIDNLGYDLFQLEMDDEIIISHKDYRNRELFAGSIITILGVAFMITFFWVYKNQNTLW